MLRAGAAVVCAAALALLPTACATNPDPGVAVGAAVATAIGEPQAVAPGVFVLRGVQEEWGRSNLGQVANTGFIIGSRCVAVIDSGGSLAGGLALKAAIARITPLPVCYVINTHAHPDHVLGNAAFQPLPAAAGADAAAAPQFVGHAHLAAALAVRGPHYLRALQRDFGPAHADVSIVPPTLPVAEELEVDLGERRLLLQAWPTAHTDADLTVYDLTTRSMWFGDLLFVQHIPVLDGSLKGWLQVMTQLRPLPVAMAIPGHGAPARRWRVALEQQRLYLTRLLDDTRAAIHQGVTLPQAVERIAADPSARWELTPLFHKRNVTAAYAELEWEP